MFKFALDEYVKNIWYNIISVFILAVSIIVSTIFITNLIQETKVYRLVKPYLDEKSIIINSANGIDVSLLSKVENTLMTHELFCMSDNQIGLNTCVVYTDEVMKIMPPRLLEGQLIEKVEADEDTLVVWISRNSGGLSTGDEITLNFFSATEEKTIKVKALIAGVIADGQRIFMSDTTISSNMEYDDIYCLYSHRQMGTPVVITTEDELSKIDEELYGQNKKCIVKFQENITEEERLENYFKVVDMEEATHGHSSVGTFPESEQLYENMKASVRSTIMKYVPLTFILLVLITVCIMGIVLIKNANSTEYYRILSICGMSARGAVCITGLEMLINSILSIIIAISFVELQNKYVFFGKINCRLDSIQICVMVTICLIVILLSMLITRVYMEPAKRKALQVP